MGWGRRQLQGAHEAWQLMFPGGVPGDFKMQATNKTGFRSVTERLPELFNALIEQSEPRPQHMV